MVTSSLVIRRCRFLSGDGRDFPLSDIRMVLSEEGTILSIEPSLNDSNATVIDAGGDYLMPAFTDIGYCPPSPRYPQRDSAETAFAAATAGGYRRLVAFPHDGVPDDPRVVTVCPLIDPRAAAEGKSALYADAPGETSLAFRREAFLACAKSDSVYLSSALDLSLCGGAVSEGMAARLSGTKGIPVSAETAALARDLILAEETGCRLHVPAIASASALAMIRQAKKQGVRVTCGVSPFHLVMTEEDIAFYGVMCKLLPPLRTCRDREALREALFDGTVDTVSSLHTPLTKAEKGMSLAKASYGLAGIEITLSVLLTYLPVLAQECPWRLAELLAVNPAAIVGEDCRLSVGNAADFVLVNPHTELVVSANTLKSKSVNTPFLGQTLTGRVTALYLRGKRA